LIATHFGIFKDKIVELQKRNHIFLCVLNKKQFGIRIFSSLRCRAYAGRKFDKTLQTLPKEKRQDFLPAPNPAL